MPREIRETHDWEIHEGRAIVFELLGPGFTISHDFYLDTVGVKGDERVDGRAVSISMLDGDPIKFMTENPDLLATLSEKLCGDCPSFTRVIWEMRALPEVSDDPNENAQPS